MRDRPASLIVAALLVQGLALLTVCSRAVAAPNGEPGGAKSDKAETVGYEPESACPVPPSVSTESERPLADEFFARGKALWASGKLTMACDCLQKSDRLAPRRGGTMLALGLCREEQGQLAIAYRELQNARAKAHEDGRADREELALQHLRALEPRLGWLTVVLRDPEPAAKGSFWLDGAPVSIEGPALPLEAGTHVLKVEMPGFVAQELSFVLTHPGERRTLEIPALERRAPAPPPEAPDRGTHSNALSGGVNPGPARAARTEPRGAASPASSGPTSPSLTPLKTATLALGVAGLVVSLGAGAWALERKATVHAECDAAKQCTEKGLSAVSTGRTLLVVGTTAFALGAVSLGAWVMLPSSGTSNSARIAVGGVF